MRKGEIFKAGHIEREDMDSVPLMCAQRDRQGCPARFAVRVVSPIRNNPPHTTTPTLIPFCLENKYKKAALSQEKHSGRLSRQPGLGGPGVYRSFWKKPAAAPKEPGVHRMLWSSSKREDTSSPAGS